MSNSTPGPWIVMYSTPPIGESTLAVWPYGTVEGQVGSPICKVSPESLENDTDRANARLIAAAPELFELTMRLMTALSTYGRHPILEQRYETIVAKIFNEKEVIK